MTQATKLTQQDLKIYPSQRLTDTPDGGGLMVGTPLTGADNELFSPVSDVDRTMGAFDARLVYPGVLRNDTEPLYGAHFVISEPPKAANVSYLCFRANGYGDMRQAIMPRIEAYSVPTIESRMTLLGTQLRGTRIVQAYQRVEAPLPIVGQRYCLKSGTDAQYIRVSDVKDEVRNFETPEGKEFQRRVIKMTVSDALVYDFVGIAYPDPRYANSPAKMLETQVADTGNYYGVRPLASDVAAGSAGLRVDGIFEKLVPTSTVETAFADQRPVGAGMWIPTAQKQVVAAHGGYTSSTMYLTCSVLPGSVELGNYKDNGLGQLVDGNNMLSVDYAAGTISGANLYAITVRAIPAAYITMANYTAIINIDDTNQGAEWAPLLKPKPAPGSVAVSFISGGEWYALKDHGDYVLRDARNNACGTITRSGSCIISLPALPDVGSKIVIAWSPLDFFKNVDGGDVGAEISAQNQSTRLVLPSSPKPNIKPGTVTLTWSSNGGKSATDDGAGNLTGDCSGRVDYAAGLIYPVGINAAEVKVALQQYSNFPAQVNLAFNSDTVKFSGNLGTVVAGGVAITANIKYRDAVQFYPKSPMAAPLVYTG